MKAPMNAPVKAGRCLGRLLNSLSASFLERNQTRIRLRTVCALAISLLSVLVLAAYYIASPLPPQSTSSSIVISQIYGGGGNSGAPFKNDFIELFNRGTATVNVTGWSVQYAAAASNSWQVTNLPSVSLAP